MNIKWKCNSCGQDLTTDSKYAGAKVECPKCKKPLFVPSAQPSTGNTSPAGSSQSGQGFIPLDRAAEILGIPGNADLKQARKTYRQLAKLYHPDIGKEPSAKNFIEITGALEVFKKIVNESAYAQIPIPGYGWDQFMTELRVATQQSLEVAEEQLDIMSARVKELIERQIMTYGSRDEFQKRAENDVNAIVQREVWAYIQRVGRRTAVVEKAFRSWVGRIRDVAHEVDLPHGLFDYLKHPGRILLSIIVFAILFSGTLIAINFLPTNPFENKTLATLSMVLVSGFITVLSAYGAYGLFMLSARKKKRHLLAVTAGEVGMEGLQVGAVPISDALSSQERAGLSGAGAGALAIWLSVEPITAAIAAAACATWGLVTGKSLGKMKREATESLIRIIEMRLEDFYDGFVHNIIEINNQRLERMRLIYLRMLGPDRLVWKSTNETLGIKVPEQKSAFSSRSGEEASLPCGVEQNVEAFLSKCKSIFFNHAAPNLCVKPNIPEKKLVNTLASYARDVKTDNVLVLYDSTWIGNAKEGVCLSSEWLFWRNPGEEPQKMLLREIDAVEPYKPQGFFDFEGMVVNGKKIVVDDRALAIAFVQVVALARDAASAEGSTIICAKCGQENADTTNFCSKCGNALKGQVFQ